MKKQCSQILLLAGSKFYHLLLSVDFINSLSPMMDSTSESLNLEKVHYNRTGQDFINKIFGLYREFYTAVFILKGITIG